MRIRLWGVQLQPNLFPLILLLLIVHIQEVAELQPDLIIGDATANFGHWLTALTGIPSIEFDVGTSSGLLHSLHGGQFNPAYVPAPGEAYAPTLLGASSMRHSSL
jgi:hypothetical protein